MTKLVIKHRQIEAQIQLLQTELAAIERNPEYQRDKEFEVGLRDLMAEYGKSLRNIILIMDPEPGDEISDKPARGPRPGTPRKRNLYKNPHTGEQIETGSGNHAVLKAWKSQHPNEDIKSWIIESE